MCLSVGFAVLGGVGVFVDAVSGGCSHLYPSRGTAERAGDPTNEAVLIRDGR
jgi:hypothetical protein